jgi:mRNA-degrading endonuclease toxin of MazEF toxin-antitoxin module
VKQGDIYLVSLDPTAGHEQQGTRPVLIVSPAKFNALTKVPVVVPITTGGGFARTAGFAVPLAGTRTTGVARCDQPRSIDIGARRGRRVETVPSAILDEVLAKLSPIFERSDLG